MPIPDGQSCANCQFYIARAGPEANHGSCQINQPGVVGSVENVSWPGIYEDDWCGRWAGASGTSGLQGSDVGVGYRGSTPTGDILALTPTLQLLTPSFAAITNTLNFELTSPGIITLDYTTYTPSPTFEIYVTVMGVIVIRSATNNQALSVTIGQNGTPNQDFAVPSDVKTTGEAVPIPVAAGLTMQNGDTVSFWAKDDATGSANLIAYHMLLEGFRVITY